MKNNNEHQFYQSLEKVFTGANVEGDGGYINLLKIKSSYYKKILNRFKHDIEAEPSLQNENFKEEFFERLFSFFEKYFSESGSVYFVKTANWQKVYEKVYTDNRDVVLFWKTHMLYYVKSDILFNSIGVEIEDEEAGKKHKFFFDVGELKNKQNNEKKEIIFIYKETRENTHCFEVTYSKNGSKTKASDIVKAIKVSEDTIHKAFNTFKKQSEVDFFINKNAEKFLTEQLDLYLHQILLKEKNIFEQGRLEQLKTVKTFALKIISFIAQFEDELVRVWNKPKFVLNSNYVITIDKLSKEILAKISTHQNLKEQIKEWNELGMVDDGFDLATIKSDGLLDELDTQYQHLPIDTKYFKDLEIEILGLFDDLDDALDGRLIHSENYQALNTLQKKYKGKVQCIYIDPPFNLGQNADFDYKVNYKDSNWATVLENRIRLAHKLLSETGSIFVRCDYNGNFIVRCLLDEIFGKENFRNEIILNRGKQTRKANKKYLNKTDSLFFYFKNQINGCLTILDTEKDLIKSVNKTLFHIKKNLTDNEYNNLKSKLLESYWMPFLSMPGENKNKKARFLYGIQIDPPKGRHWAFSQENLEIALNKKLARLLCLSCQTVIGHTLGKSVCPNCGNNNFEGQIYSLYNQQNNNWTDIDSYEQDPSFSTKNSEILLQRVIESVSNKHDLVLDFFAGSATTQAVAQKLGRKWLGVEMGDQFHDVDIPRLKQVFWGKQSGISKALKKEEKYIGGGVFKYESLEQYEDTLRNMKYNENSPADIFNQKKPFEEYIFYADKKFAHVLELDKDTLKVDFDKLYQHIDFPETISNLLGLPIKRITKETVVLQDGQEERCISYDYKNMNDNEKLDFVRMLRPLLWWGK